MNTAASIFNFLIISFIAVATEAITLSDNPVFNKNFFSVGLECISSNPLTWAEMNSFKHNMVPEGKNPKCFTACMFKKMGFMDEMGMLSVSGAVEKAAMLFKDNEAPVNNVKQLMESCEHVNEYETNDGDTECERAKQAFTCLIENSSKYGFAFDGKE